MNTQATRLRKQPYLAVPPSHERVDVLSLQQTAEEPGCFLGLVRDAFRGCTLCSVDYVDARRVNQKLPGDGALRLIEDECLYITLRGVQNCAAILNFEYYSRAGKPGARV